MKTHDGDTSNNWLFSHWLFPPWTSSLHLLLKLSLPEMEVGPLLSETVDQKTWVWHVLSHFAYLFIYLRERAQAGGAGGERESQADPMLSTEAHLRTLRSRPEPKPRVTCLTDCTAQEPLSHFKWVTYMPCISVSPSLKGGDTRACHTGWWDAQRR